MQKGLGDSGMWDQLFFFFFFPQLFFLNGKWNHIVNIYFCQARMEKRKPPFSIMKGTCTRQKRGNSHGLRRKDETLSQMHLAG